MNGGMLFYSISVVGAYLPFLRGCENKSLPIRCLFQGGKTTRNDYRFLCHITVMNAVPAYFALAKIAIFFARQKKYGSVLLCMGLVSIFCHIRHAFHLTFIR